MDRFKKLTAGEINWSTSIREYVKEREKDDVHACRRMRKKAARKLGNPKILRIHFHTFRHWKATIEYARTKDILYVKQLLGHKAIKTTLKYVQLVDLPHEEKFICKVAQNADEATELIEAGFEYVTGEYDDGGKLFRKRKISYLGSRSSPVGSWSSMV